MVPRQDYYVQISVYDTTVEELEKQLRMFEAMREYGLQFMVLEIPRFDSVENGNGNTMSFEDWSSICSKEIQNDISGTGRLAHGSICEEPIHAATANEFAWRTSGASDCIQEIGSILRESRQLEGSKNMPAPLSDHSRVLTYTPFNYSPSMQNLMNSMEGYFPQSSSVYEPDQEEKSAFELNNCIVSLVNDMLDKLHSTSPIISADNCTINRSIKNSFGLNETSKHNVIPYAEIDCSRQEEENNSHCLFQDDEDMDALSFVTASELDFLEKSAEFCTDDDHTCQAEPASSKDWDGCHDLSCIRIDKKSQASVALTEMYHAISNANVDYSLHTTNIVRDASDGSNLSLSEKQSHAHSEIDSDSLPLIAIKHNIQESNSSFNELGYLERAAVSEDDYKYSFASFCEEIEREVNMIEVQSESDDKTHDNGVRSRGRPKGRRSRSSKKLVACQLPGCPERLAINRSSKSFRVSRLMRHVMTHNDASHACFYCEYKSSSFKSVRLHHRHQHPSLKFAKKRLTKEELRRLLQICFPDLFSGLLRK